LSKFPPPRLLLGKITPLLFNIIPTTYKVQLAPTA
jgi:hypothetical protein